MIVGDIIAQGPLLIIWSHVKSFFLNFVQKLMLSLWRTLLNSHWCVK